MPLTSRLTAVALAAAVFLPSTAGAGIICPEAFSRAEWHDKMDDVDASLSELTSTRGAPG